MKIAIMFLLVIGTILSLQLATIKATAIGTSTTRHQTEFLSGDLRCETTTGSPHIRHIKSAYARINARVGEMCRQDNIGGSECTTIWWEGDAGITICGEHNGAISCPDVAYAARQIYDNCVWGERFAGGWFQFHDRAENWVVVFFKDK